METPTTKSLVQEILETTMLVRSYSGIGMYGQSCLAVDADNIGEVMVALFEHGTDSGDGLTGEQCAELRDAFQGVRVDTCGLGLILYFPDIQFVQGEDPNEDD